MLTELRAQGPGRRHRAHPRARASARSWPCSWPGPGIDSLEALRAAIERRRAARRRREDGAEHPRGPRPHGRQGHRPRPRRGRDRAGRGDRRAPRRAARGRGGHVRRQPAAHARDDRRRRRAGGLARSGRRARGVPRAAAGHPGARRGRQEVVGAHRARHPGRPARGRARRLRRRAAVLHRLQGAQRPHPRARRAPQAAAQRVRPVPPRRGRRAGRAHRRPHRARRLRRDGHGVHPAARCERTAARSTPRSRTRSPPSCRLTDLRGDLHGHSHFSGDGKPHAGGDGGRRGGGGYASLGGHRPLREPHDERHVARGHRGAPRRDRRVSRSAASCILEGLELNIAMDGTVDYDPDLLDSMAWNVASIHSHMRYDAAVQTERTLQAIANPRSTAIGHPTGRKIGVRPGYEIELAAILEACRETGTALEVNASPRRLDLSGDMVRPRSTPASRSRSPATRTPSATWARCATGCGPRSAAGRPPRTCSTRGPWRTSRRSSRRSARVGDQVRLPRAFFASESPRSRPT